MQFSQAKFWSPNFQSVVETVLLLLCTIFLILHLLTGKPCVRKGFAPLLFVICQFFRYCMGWFGPDQIGLAWISWIIMAIEFLLTNNSLANSNILWQVVFAFIITCQNRCPLIGWVYYFCSTNFTCLIFPLATYFLVHANPFAIYKVFFLMHYHTYGMTPLPCHSV